ncbi:transposase [Paracoccus actinidiae]|uniref:transposase n=1 Tax=Paracoccus actinidiae TaxID=3064531 RepID=UPI00359C4CCE
MAHPFWLSDAAWLSIEPHLPRGLPGKPRVDDRRVISGILPVLKTGCRWRDVPAAYGPPTTLHKCLTRWSHRGSGNVCSRACQPQGGCRFQRNSVSTAPT